MNYTLDIWPDIETKINKDVSAIKNPAFKGAFMKGVIACRELGLKAENPYKPIYQDDMKGGTFAMAFMNYWNRGWNAYKKHSLEYCGISNSEVKDRPTTKYQWDINQIKNRKLKQ